MAWLAGNKGNGPEALARILHQHGLAKRLSVGGKNGVTDLLYRGVDGPHQRNSGKQSFPEINQATAEQVRPQGTRNKNHCNDRQKPEAWNVKAKEGLW
jgi:hypothetical protein